MIAISATATKHLRMPLTYPPEWKFDDLALKPSDDFVEELTTLAGRIANGTENPQPILERFKFRFGELSKSSNAYYAAIDLKTAMGKFGGSAVEFIDSFWSGVEDAKAGDAKVPSEEMLNRLFAKHDVPYVIHSSKLERNGVEAPVSPPKPSAPQSPPRAPTPPPSSPPHPPSAPPPAYDVGERLGSGAHGATYKAHQKSVDRLVALKWLNPSAPSALVAEEQARALARAKNDYVVVVHDVVSLEHPRTRAVTPCIVMDFVDGFLLAHSLRGAGGISRESLVASAAGIIAGIKHIHASGLTHGDLHTENIILRRGDGRPIIIDLQYWSSLAATTRSKEADLQRDVRGLGEVLLDILRYAGPEDCEVGDFRTNSRAATTIDEVVGLFTDTLKNVAIAPVSKPQPPTTTTTTGGNLDVALFQEIRRVLTEAGVIGFLRSNNFAGFSFKLERLEPLIEIDARRNDPAFEFLDPELEPLRARLSQNIHEFEKMIATNTFPTARDGTNTVPPEWEREAPDRFAEVVAALHDGARDVCAAYDDLVRIGRRKLNV